ncbi:MAG: hypothetical protein WBE13_19515 [Candidatus Acidiferrum sp.]
MFSNHVISVAGRSITITSQELFMGLMSLVICLLFLAVLYLIRRRVVILKRSSGTDQVAFELARIADSLERIANRAAERAIAAAARRQLQAQVSPPQQRESKGVAYSMSGR